MYFLFPNESHQNHGRLQSPLPLPSHLHAVWKEVRKHKCEKRQTPQQHFHRAVRILNALPLTIPTSPLSHRCIKLCKRRHSCCIEMYSIHYYFYTIFYTVCCFIWETNNCLLNALIKLSFNLQRGRGYDFKSKVWISKTMQESFKTSFFEAFI